MILPFCGTVVRRVQRKEQAATEANLRRGWWGFLLFLVALVWVFINVRPVLEKYLAFKIIPFIKVGQFSLAVNKP